MKYFVIALTLFSVPAHSTRRAMTVWYKMTRDRDLIGVIKESSLQKSDTVHVQTDLWLKQGSRWTREHVGAMAANDKNLTPRVYQHYVDDSARYVDAVVRVSKDWQLERSIQKGRAKLPATRIRIPPGTIWSTLLPIWLQRRLKELSKDRPLTFQALVEELLTSKNPVSEGSIRILAEDEFSKRHRLKKLEIRYHNRIHHWWIDAQGKVVRAVIPSEKLTLQLISPKSAKAFLDSIPTSATSTQ